MRGTKNLYHATAVRLFGFVVAYEVAVNNVPVARVVNDGSYTVSRRDSKIRLNPNLLREACEKASC